MERKAILEKIETVKGNFIDIYNTISNSNLSYSIKFEDEINLHTNIEINTSIINLIEVIETIDSNKSMAIDELNTLYNEYLTYKDSLQNAVKKSGKNRNIYLRNAMIINNDIIARLVKN